MSAEQTSLDLMAASLLQIKVTMWVFIAVLALRACFVDCYVASQNEQISRLRHDIERAVVLLETVPVAFVNSRFAPQGQSVQTRPSTAPAEDPSVANAV